MNNNLFLHVLFIRVHIDCMSMKKVSPLWEREITSSWSNKSRYPVLMDTNGEEIPVNKLWLHISHHQAKEKVPHHIFDNRIKYYNLFFTNFKNAVLVFRQ